MKKLVIIMLFLLTHSLYAHEWIGDSTAKELFLLSNRVQLCTDAIEDSYLNFFINCDIKTVVNDYKKIVKKLKKIEKSHPTYFHETTAQFILDHFDDKFLGMKMFDTIKKDTINLRYINEKVKRYYNLRQEYIDKKRTAPEINFGSTQDKVM